jgi:hypothetical protein
MEARVAVLEEIAKSTKEMLADIRADQRAFRVQTDANFDKLRDQQRTDFRITWGGLIAVALGLAALMAKGFHWL